MDSPHRIHRSLLFLALVAAGSAACSWWGLSLRVGNLTVLSFPEFSLSGGEMRIHPEDVETLLATYEDTSLDGDSTETGAGLELETAPELAAWLTAARSALPDKSDSTLVLRSVHGSWAAQRAAGTWKPATLHPNLHLHGDSAAFQSLWRFFEQATRGAAASHVFHFGDSQIEGDRITSELRQAFQRRWGGTGPGYVSAVPQSQVPGFAQTADGWVRYTLFGKRDSTLGHERYGALATVGRWAGTDDSNWTSPIEFKARNMGHARNRVWPALHLLAGPLPDGSLPVRIRCDSTTYSAQLVGDTTSSALHVALPLGCTEISVEFKAPGPDLNAIGFFGDSGIVVHNVPMRGSSGTLFRKADRSHWVDQITEHRPTLILLQYGGNTVPYIENADDAAQYGRWLASQIQLFQSTLPGVPIVLIGPSDMSTKDGLNFVTHPHLLEVREALQAMAWQEHVLFWDLFAVMGGANSMPAWVQADPPLASADHIHFTGRGARRVGNLLADAFMAEAALWAEALSSGESKLPRPSIPAHDSTSSKAPTEDEAGLHGHSAGASSPVHRIP